jgi:carboxylesterase
MLTFSSGDRAVLLIHGFTGSTGEVEELGQQLAAAGYTTVLPTLPGHDTAPEDLFDVTWRDWFDSVTSAYQTIRQRHSQVAVGGLSMGGTLALHLAAHFPEIGAVFGLAAAIRLRTWQRMAAGLLHPIVGIRRKARKADVRNEVALERLRSYDRYPLRAANELFKLCDHVYDDLPEVRQPALLIHSVRDNTVPVDNVHLISERIRSTSKEIVLLQDSYHVITVDVERGRVTAEVQRFLQQVFEKEGGLAQTTETQSAQSLTRRGE